MPRKSVDNIIQSLGQNGSVSDLAQSLDFDRDPDFKKPLYNVWNFAKLSNDVKHFGNLSTKDNIGSFAILCFHTVSNLTA